MIKSELKQRQDHDPALRLAACVRSRWRLVAPLPFRPQRGGHAPAPFEEEGLPLAVWTEPLDKNGPVFISGMVLMPKSHIRMPGCWISSLMITPPMVSGMVTKQASKVSNTKMTSANEAPSASVCSAAMGWIWNGAVAVT